MQTQIIHIHTHTQRHRYAHMDKYVSIALIACEICFQASFIIMEEGEIQRGEDKMGNLQY